MAAFADPPDLSAFLQRSDVKPATAVLLLDIASGIIRGHVGWSITSETGVTFTTQGTGSNVIWLPTKRLTGVTSVTEDGVLLTADTHYRWTTSGRLRRVSGRWLCEERSVDVVFDHGLAASPDDVKGVCLSLASRLNNNPEGLRSYSIDGVSVTATSTTSSTVTSSSLTLSEQEKIVLDPYVLDGFA